MELDKKTIQLRIDIIERNLKEIEKISKEIKKMSYRDELALKHALLECIEACVDISNHIISVKGFRRPTDYSDVFVVLEENKIIDKDFSKHLQEMAKFRNVLVHRYALVNRGRLLKIIKEDVKDIKEFIKIILKLLK
ncbi:MAG: DUF86 domain-containing protein [Candidatus Aenigmatarchaeota archaeon]